MPSAGEILGNTTPSVDANIHKQDQNIFGVTMASFHVSDIPFEPLLNRVSSFLDVGVQARDDHRCYYSITRPHILRTLSNTVVYGQ